MAIVAATRGAHPAAVPIMVAAISIDRLPLSTQGPVSDERAAASTAFWASGLLSWRASYTLSRAFRLRSSSMTSPTIAYLSPNENQA